MSEYLSVYKPTLQELEILRNCEFGHDSGYHGVYPHRRGWIPKAFKIQVGPVQPTANEAAKLLARWWHEQFGPEWPKFFAMRKRQAHQFICTPAGYWIIRIWMLGSMQVCCDRKGKTLKFKTREAASKGFDDWKRDTFGLFSTKSSYWIRRKAFDDAGSPLNTNSKDNLKNRVVSLFG
jgi:hypothetical protein